jgi:hypothetical protein
MKKALILTILLFTIANINSQITYEKGYYINNSGQKIECLIKNYDWRDTPNEIEFKISESNTSRTITINDVKEFEIYNSSKHIRVEVDIDRSSENLDELSRTRSPNFKQEKLFLKTLIEGKHSLYEYSDGNLIRYFYNNENKIEQLVFKSYYFENNILKENNRFRQQLLSSLKCDDIKQSKFKNLKYKKSNLIPLFKSINECEKEKYINYTENSKGVTYNFTLRPRLNLSSLKTQTSQNINDFGSKIGIGFGIEAELVLPYNKNKWSILIEPTYQSYKSETNNLKADYKSIEVPLGLRHSFFTSNNSKIFVNGLYVLDYAFNSEANNLDIRTNSSLGFGIGYKKDDKYSIELRHIFTRHLFADYLFAGSEYKTFSLIIGYSL